MYDRSILRIPGPICLFAMLWFAFSQVSAAQSPLTGRVTNENGEGLAGVNIAVRGTQIGTVTDGEGRFVLEAIQGDVLVFSYVGMKTQEVVVGIRSVINVRMVPDLATVDEVVITALGRPKEQRVLGYSAQTVEAIDLEGVAESNIVSALNGKFAGVDITPSGGGAGAAANIVVRGYSSISGDNQPLFVVDGVPISNITDPSNPNGDLQPRDWRAYSITRGTNRAIDVNQFDIESISVLKGGAATAMYGSRASNGAILIKTKGGHATDRGFDVTVRSTVEVSDISLAPDIQEKFTQGSGGVFDPTGTQNYGPAYADSPVFPDGTIIDLDMDGTTEDVSGQKIPNYSGYYDRFWRTGLTTRNTVGFSGANDRGSLYASFTNVDEESILPKDKYQKRSVFLKGELALTDRFTIGGASNYTRTDLTTFPIGYRGPAYALSTIFNPVYDVHGPWKDSQGNSTFYITSNAKTTPTWIINEEPEDGAVNRLIGNLNLAYELTPRVNVSYKLGVDTYDEKKKRVRPIGSPFVERGDIYDVYINSRDVNSDLLIFGRTAYLNGDLGVGFLVGNNIFEQHYDRAFIKGERLSVRGFGDISNATEVSVTNTIKKRRIVGVFGQLDFDYKNFLFAELSARNDWSSTLSSDRNSYLYPSASVGFVFSRFVRSDVLSHGKVRASIARVGNDAPIYATTDTYYLSGIFDNQSAFSISDEAKNSAIRPEISTTWEVGTDLAFWDYLIGLNFTYYNRRTEDQIARASLPGSTGYTSYVLNAGVIENKGVETMLSFNNLLRRTAHWSWDVDLNFSRNRNEVLEIPSDLNEIIIGSSAWFGANVVVKPGHPYGSLSGSYYERDPQGRLLIGDDGFPIIASDRRILGDPNPDWRMSISNGLRYKNWRLNLLFDIKKGGDLFNESRLAMWWYGTDADIEKVGTPHVFDGIVKSSGEANTQEVILSENYFKSKVSFVDEPAVEDASWVRLRNVSISYRLVAPWLQRTFVENIVFTAAGRNLWISTDYSGTDPESASALGPGNVQIIDMFGVPGTRSFSFTVEVNF